MSRSFGTKEELDVKVKEYSTFIDTKLHPELKKRVDAREQVEEEIADYRDLSTKLKARVAQQDDSPLEAMVDLHVWKLSQTISGHIHPCICDMPKTHIQRSLVYTIPVAFLAGFAQELSSTFVHGYCVKG
jgi:hypothetical protein